MAQELLVISRTVNRHPGSIYTKPGKSSRRAAPDVPVGIPLPENGAHDADAEEAAVGARMGAPNG